MLIEGRDKGISVGRSYRDAPEIDGLVLVEGRAAIGDIVPVKITGAMAYDLTGLPARALPVHSSEPNSRLVTGGNEVRSLRLTMATAGPRKEPLISSVRDCG